MADQVTMQRETEREIRETAALSDTTSDFDPMDLELLAKHARPGDGSAAAFAYAKDTQAWLDGELEKGTAAEYLRKQLDVRLRDIASKVDKARSERLAELQDAVGKRAAEWEKERTVNGFEEMSQADRRARSLSAAGDDELAEMAKDYTADPLSPKWDRIKVVALAGELRQRGHNSHAEVREIMKRFNAERPYMTEPDTFSKLSDITMYRAAKFGETVVRAGEKPGQYIRIPLMALVDRSGLRQAQAPLRRRRRR